MRLKELTLTGYKTFADKTKFEFDAGITAVIGPNGSGKSNVADAIRWALGEQAYSVLRGKKTDDMIFSGSAKRSRSSMAEVLMTFDNSDGFFPIEFSEISLGRRAYRDGANEYVLNGNRVRLKDVSELLGNSGLAERTYTVIGQGLVDSALQAKPDERRALFEEAAGIGTYRDRRDDALRKLEETRHNLERARDILSEITPRVKTLERQAERARSYTVLAAELDQHTRLWFAYHFATLKTVIAQSTMARDACATQAAAARASAEAQEQRVAGLRGEQAGLREQLQVLLPMRDATRRRNEAASRELAVLRERGSSHIAQISSAEREIEERAGSISDLEQRVQLATEMVTTTQTQLTARQLELDAAQQVATTVRAARAGLERQRSSAQQELMRFNAQIAGSQNRLNVLRNRQTALKNVMGEFNQRTERTAANKTRDAELQVSHKLGLDQDVQRLAELSTAVNTAQQTHEQARATLGEVGAQHAASEAEFKMAERMNTFVQLRAQSRDGDLAAAAHNAGLQGYRGTLANMIKIHPDDERAVRAALGDALNAVVVETREGLTHARAWMARQTNTNGRLALLALPALRTIDDEYDLGDRTVLTIARGQNARLLADLVNCEPWLQPAVRLLLGRAFLCRDLDSANTLAQALPPGCMCVTRDGEAAFPSGGMQLVAGTRRAMVIGSDGAVDDDTLLLDLDTAKARLSDVKARRTEAEAQVTAARARLEEATRVRVQFEREAGQRRNQHDELQRQLARYDDQTALIQTERGRAEVELTELRVTMTTVAGDIERDEARQATAQQALAAIEHQLREQSDRTDAQGHLFQATGHAQSNDASATRSESWMDALNRTTAQMATAQAQLRAAEGVLGERRAEVSAARLAHQQRVAWLQAIHTEREQSAHKLGKLSAEHEQSATEIGEIEARLKPIQEAMAEIDRQVFDADTVRREAERTLREAESALTAAELEVARHHDEMTSLQARAVDALGEPEPAPAISPESTTSTDATVSGMVTTADTAAEHAQVHGAPVELAAEAEPEFVMELPEGTDERMLQLRGQIKRLGAINFEAQTEFDELSKRHKFISEQSEDLEKASASLQAIITDLNDVMNVTFREVFDRIAREFQDTFKMLFGGGQARLTLINADNLDESGVEITAQPPGKRPQSLALLSGGERSMTAAALLFAILKVKPTPFCVLDEMDAALDEANVYRFRSMLESLIDTTQFIVITHNRRTVEAAKTIYGISMGSDSASIALSLKIDEAEARLRKD